MFSKVIFRGTIASKASSPWLPSTSVFTSKTSAGTTRLRWCSSTFISTSTFLRHGWLCGWSRSCKRYRRRWWRCRGRRPLQRKSGAVSVKSFYCKTSSFQLFKWLRSKRAFRSLFWRRHRWWWKCGRTFHCGAMGCWSWDGASGSSRAYWWRQTSSPAKSCPSLFG